MPTFTKHGRTSQAPFCSDEECYAPATRQFMFELDAFCCSTIVRSCDQHLEELRKYVHDLIEREALHDNPLVGELVERRLGK